MLVHVQTGLSPIYSCFRKLLWKGLRYGRVIGRLNWLSSWIPPVDSYSASAKHSARLGGSVYTCTSISTAKILNRTELRLGWRIKLDKAEFNLSCTSGPCDCFCSLEFLCFGWNYQRPFVRNQRTTEWISVRRCVLSLTWERTWLVGCLLRELPHEWVDWLAFRASNHCGKDANSCRLMSYRQLFHNKTRHNWTRSLVISCGAKLAFIENAKQIEQRLTNSNDS